MMELEPFVDSERGAEFLGITSRRLVELARAGVIPAHSIGHGRRKTWRFRLSEIAEAVSSTNRRLPQITAVSSKRAVS
jgi:hypothetical protein